MEKTIRTKRVLVPLADGFDEIEAFTLISTLKRAKLDVRVIGLQGVILKGSDGTRIISDGRMDDIDASAFDAIALVSGTPERMANSDKVIRAIRAFNDQKKVVAAIGDAPLLLVKAGLLEDKRATIRPGLEKSLGRPRGEAVVVDGNIITASSPSCAMEFGLKVVESVASKDALSYVREVLRRGK